MSRRIKTSILRSNNLAVLGSLSRATSNCCEEQSNQSNQSSRYTLKSLSQERNIVKILRKIDSPCKLQLSSAHLKEEVYETLFTIQEQVHALGQRRRQLADRRDSGVMRRGVPHSKISLADNLIDNKENTIRANTPVETTRSRSTERASALNISKSILNKLKVIPLQSNDVVNCSSSCTMRSPQQHLHTAAPSKQSLNVSTRKRNLKFKLGRGIHLYQRVK